MKSSANKSAILDRCEDAIIDLMINTTPYPPNESTKIRMFISYRMEKLTAPYKAIISNDDINDKVDNIESMYVAYCKLTERVYGSYSA